MNKILTILLFLFSTILHGQTIDEMGIAEYRSAVLATDGSVWANYWSGSSTHAVKISGSMVFTQIDGGQYNYVLLRDNGGVYLQNNGNTTLQYLQYDSDGNTFTAVYVECYFQCYIAIGTNGKIYFRGYNHYNWVAGGTDSVLSVWTLIPNQPSVSFVKTRKGGAPGSGQLVALTSTGTVYTVNDNTTTWNLKSFPAAVDDIHAAYRGFYIAMIDSLPYGWGQRKYLTNVVGTISTYEALADDWSLGSHKIIDIAVSDWTIHYITDDNKLWGMGNNAMGQVGLGWELVNRCELYSSCFAGGWEDPTTGDYQQWAFVGTPTQVASDKTFKRVWASDYFAYYCFAQELSTDNLYGWGRAKSGALLTSGTTIDGKGWSNESTYANAADVLSPKLINYFSYTLPSPSSFVLPTVNAGSDQSISTASTTLTGSATAGHTSSWSFSVSSYEWTKVSGPSCTIASPTAASTGVTGMSNGVYTFQLKTTDNNTATVVDNVTVTVSALVDTLTIVASATSTGSGTASLSSTTNTPHGVTWRKWSVLSRPGITPFKIGVGGSSTPAGSTGVTSVDSAWPWRYKAFLKSHNVLDTMYNRALGGTDTRHGLPTSTNGYGVSSFDTSRNITAFVKRNVHLVIQGYASNSMTSFQPADHLGWFREIRDSSQIAGITYYVTTTQPRPGYNTTEEVKLKTIRDSQLVQFNCIEAYKPLVIPGTMNFRTDLDYGDGIHTNDKGQGILANNMIGTNPLGYLAKGSAVFTDSSAQNTTVSGLTQGTWKFIAAVQDTNGYTAYQVVTLEVPAPPANEPPTCNAGSDQTVNASSVTVAATADDTDGTIIQYGWEQVSGPDGANIVAASSAETSITFEGSGIYVYKVIVQDDDGATAEDTITITVTIPPTVRGIKFKRFGKFNFNRPE